MTLIEMAICVTALTTLSTSANKKFDYETHQAIAMNICSAANKTKTDPQLLAAYILTENSYFDPFLDKQARVGTDRGLYHTNSYFHGRRANYSLVNHPYYGTEIAANIIHENFRRFGPSWQAIAAYWNPKKAEEKDASAKAYYERWLVNFNKAQQTFKSAALRVNATLGGSH